MRRLFYTLLALLIYFSAFGQGNLTFLYDNAGNCYRKYLTVVMNLPAKPNAENDDEQPQTKCIVILK